MASSTVLRFVTVRSPRKPDDADRQRNFIFYDDVLNAPLIAAQMSIARNWDKLYTTVSGTDPWARRVVSMSAGDEA